MLVQVPEAVIYPVCRKVFINITNNNLKKTYFMYLSLIRYLLQSNVPQLQVFVATLEGIAK